MLLLLAVPAGCGAETLTLGQPQPLPAFGDSGQRPKAINVIDEDEDNPTLTEDLLEIYFTSSRPGGPGGDDVWYASRLTRADAFGDPKLVDGINSDEDETSPAISPDGLTLYVASTRPAGSSDGDYDIFFSTRPTAQSAWGPLEPLNELNSDSDDIPRPLALGGLVMPMASRRDGNDYQTYVATRADLGAKFDAPTPLTELWVEGTSMVDAFMTDDGLVVFFNREEAEGEGELYMAWRSSPRERFGEAIPLTAVNTDPGDDRDPWLSSDRTRFFFSSDRRIDGDGLDIYATTIELPAFAP